MIYLDNASTTKVDKNLKPIIDRFLFSDYYNPGSKHFGGTSVATSLVEARRAVERTLCAKEDSVIFTSSGSEANTLAIVGLVPYLTRIGKTHVLTSKYEHKSVLEAMRRLSSIGFDVEYLDVPDGRVSTEELSGKIRDNTGLVSIMFVNNELGTMNSILSMHEMCYKRDVLFHSDCVQAFGTNKVTTELADFITISGHKIHAPKGVGCLYARDKRLLTNVICGGGQEFGLRPGTENISYIVAFAHAVQNAEIGRKYNVEKMYRNSGVFKRTLMDLCENEDLPLRFNVRNPFDSPKICSIRFDGVDAETLMLMLSNNDVYVSVGSACSSNSVQPSHVLKAIGLTDEQARSTIRVSFSDYNTADEAYRAAVVIADSVRLLKTLS